VYLPSSAPVTIVFFLRPNAAHKLSGPRLGEPVALRLPEHYDGQLDALVGQILPPIAIKSLKA
jgi:hypothetical protein